MAKRAQLTPKQINNLIHCALVCYTDYIIKIAKVGTLTKHPLSQNYKKNTHFTSSQPQSTKAKSKLNMQSSQYISQHSNYDTSYPYQQQNQAIDMYQCSVTKIPQKILISPLSTTKSAQNQHIKTKIQTAKHLLSFQPISSQLFQLALQVIEDVYLALINFINKSRYKDLRPKIQRNDLMRLVDYRQCLGEEDSQMFEAFVAAIYGFRVHYCSEYFAAKLVNSIHKTVFGDQRESIPICVSQQEHKPLKQNKNGQHKKLEYTKPKKGQPVLNTPEQKPLNPDKSQSEQLPSIKPTTSSTSTRNPKPVYKRQTQTDKLNLIWSLQMQNFLLHCLTLHNEFFLRIRDQFRNKYPKHTECLSVQSLKNRYFKLLRNSFKKLRELQQFLGVQVLEHMEDVKVKHVLRSADCYLARRGLVQVHKLGGKENRDHVYGVIGKTVQAIYDCFYDFI